jgi:hypothetical protein
MNWKCGCMGADVCAGVCLGVKKTTLCDHAFVLSGQKFIICYIHCIIV